VPARATLHGFTSPNRTLSSYWQSLYGSLSHYRLFAMFINQQHATILSSSKINEPEVCRLQMYPSVDADLQLFSIYADIRGCLKQLRLRMRIIRGCRPICTLLLYSTSCSDWSILLPIIISFLSVNVVITFASAVVACCLLNLLTLSQPSSVTTSTSIMCCCLNIELRDITHE